MGPIIISLICMSLLLGISVRWAKAACVSRPRCYAWGPSGNHYSSTCALCVDHARNSSWQTLFPLGTFVSARVLEEGPVVS